MTDREVTSLVQYDALVSIPLTLYLRGETILLDVSVNHFPHGRPSPLLVVDSPVHGSLRLSFNKGLPSEPVITVYGGSPVHSTPVLAPGLPVVTSGTAPSIKVVSRPLLCE